MNIPQVSHFQHFKLFKEINNKTNTPELEELIYNKNTKNSPNYIQKQANKMKQLALSILNQNQNTFQIKKTIQKLIKQDTNPKHHKQQWKHYFLYYYLFKYSNKQQIIKISSIYEILKPACNNILRNILDLERNQTLSKYNATLHVQDGRAKHYADRR